MAGTLTYDRPKSATSNSTGIVLTVQAAEKPAALATLAGGSTGVAQVRFNADADESAGSDVQAHATFEIAPTVDAATGAVVYEIRCTPSFGNGAVGATQTFRYPHPQLLDAFQTQAGRDRQS